MITRKEREREHWGWGEDENQNHRTDQRKVAKITRGVFGVENLDPMEIKKLGIVKILESRLSFSR